MATQQAATQQMLAASSMKEGSKEKKAGAPSIPASIEVTSAAMSLDRGTKPRVRSAKFVELMHTMETPNFSTLHFFNNMINWVRARSFSASIEVTSIAPNLDRGTKK